MPINPTSAYLSTLVAARAQRFLVPVGQSSHRDATDLWRRVIAENPVNGEFWYELGFHSQQSGQYRQAIEAYEQALALGYRYPPGTAIEIARCQAAQGEGDAALGSIARARSLGYRDMASIRAVTEFSGIAGDPRFIELAGGAPDRFESREDRWAADLTFLAAEIRRRSTRTFRAVDLAIVEDILKQLKDRVSSLSDSQITAEIARTIALACDGHGYVRAPAGSSYELALPIELYLFEEGIFVVAAADEYRSLVGAELLAIDGRSADTVYEAVAPYIARDNSYWLKHQIPYYMRLSGFLNAIGLTSDPSNVRISARAMDGSMLDVVVNGVATGPATGELARNRPFNWHYLPQMLDQPLPLYLQDRAANYWASYLADEAVIYCQFNRVADSDNESLAEFADRVMATADDRAAEAMVIDLRWNDGGDTHLEMHWLHRIIASPRINRVGNLIVVVGRHTFSAAMNFATLLNRHTHAVFVGEPTGSSPNFVAEGSEFHLPYSRVEVMVSDSYWQSSWPMDFRTWIAPDIFLPPRFADFSQNRDPVLEAALAYRGRVAAMSHDSSK